MESLTIENHEKFLRKKSKEVVDLNNKLVKKCIEDLKEYCTSHELFALASIQIGYDLRIIYLKNTTLDIDLPQNMMRQRL